MSLRIGLVGSPPRGVYVGRVTARRDSQHAGGRAPSSFAVRYLNEASIQLEKFGPPSVPLSIMPLCDVHEDEEVGDPMGDDREQEPAMVMNQRPHEQPVYECQRDASPTGRDAVEVLGGMQGGVDGRKRKPCARTAQPNWIAWIRLALRLLHPNCTSVNMKRPRLTD